MTGKSLLEHEMTQSGNQLSACLNGMSEAAMDMPCSPVGMTPRAILEHLCEAYEAFILSCKGGTYNWGSFAIPDKSTENVKAVFTELRNRAVTSALESDDETNQKHAYDYIVAHDNYHVAQLVLSRLQVEPEWDSYSIYS